MDLHQLCLTLLNLGYDRVSFNENPALRTMKCALWKKGDDIPTITAVSSYPVFLDALRLATQDAIRQTNHTMGL
jgi:hypothetical protein